MTRKIGVMLAIALMVLGGAVVAVPGTTEALTITSISVTVGGATYCNVGNNNLSQGCGATAFHIWDLGVGGVNLGNGGTALVLAQNQPGVPNQSNFNFDSSEANGRSLCLGNGACQTSMFINGVAVPLSAATTANSALADFNLDPQGIENNEASNWNNAVANTGPGGYTLWFGYADTAHTLPCSDHLGSVADNCVPDNPWQGSPNTVFLGSSVAGVGCDRPGFPSCFDSGAIRIEANPTIVTPEPSAIFLLGVGLMGLAAWGRKRRMA